MEGLDGRQGGRGDGGDGVFHPLSHTHRNESYPLTLLHLSFPYYLDLTCLLSPVSSSAHHPVSHQFKHLTPSSPTLPSPLLSLNPLPLPPVSALPHPLSHTRYLLLQLTLSPLTCSPLTLSFPHPLSSHLQSPSLFPPVSSSPSCITE
jgi:hypothetical protein